jgi:hypothetical protein
MEKSFSGDAEGVNTIGPLTKTAAFISQLSTVLKMTFKSLSD